MEEFITQLKDLKSSLTNYQKNFILYIYVDNNPIEEDIDNDDLMLCETVFYINDKNSHDKGYLIYTYPDKDLVEKLLDLLEAGSLMESTYEYYGSKEELNEKLKIIQKELPNIIVTDAPFQS